MNKTPTAASAGVGLIVAVICAGCVRHVRRSTTVHGIETCGFASCTGRPKHYLSAKTWGGRGKHAAGGAVVGLTV